MLTEKLPVVEPDATVTEDGTVRAEVAELARATLVPPTGAAFDSVTVQVVEAFDVRFTAAHCSEEIVIGATSDSVTGLEDPLKEAVTVAD